MLLRFGLENHLSIKDRQELSMVNVPSLKDRKEHLIPCAASPTGHVVPVAVIYGANASGKSNVVAGMRFLRDAILYSQTMSRPGSGVPRSAFRLDGEYPKKTTIADVDFTIDGVRHEYGFETNDDQFVEEWLYAYPVRRRVLFERREQNFYFGRHLKGPNNTISEITAKNILFLSSASQYNHSYVSEVQSYFLKMENFSAINVSSERLSQEFSGDVDPRIVKYLGELGTGISDSRRAKLEIPDNVKNIQSAVNDAIKNAIEKLEKEGGVGGNDQETINIALEELDLIVQFGHPSKDGSTVFFPLERESSGTRRLALLFRYALTALDRGSLLIIDELDTSLHTQACEAIMALFSSRETNPKGAQLVATTHDTNLLRSDLLRRDQIWFAEKDRGGATHLYSLADFKIRASDNWEKGYLEGRFGAIPFAGSPLDFAEEVTYGAKEE